MIRFSLFEAIIGLIVYEAFGRTLLIEIARVLF